MTETAPLKVRINPNNQRVSILDADYQHSWVTEFERVKAELEETFRGQVSEGSLTVEADLGSAFMDTPERAVRFMAHVAAEQTMQDWALMRGISLRGISAITDHGRRIDYELDSSVPFLGYELAEATGN